MKTHKISFAHSVWTWCDRRVSFHTTTKASTDDARVTCLRCLDKMARHARNPR